MRVARASTTSCQPTLPAACPEFALLNQPALATSTGKGHTAWEFSLLDLSADMPHVSPLCLQSNALLMSASLLQTKLPAHRYCDAVQGDLTDARTEYAMACALPQVAACEWWAWNSEGRPIGPVQLSQLLYLCRGEYLGAFL